MIKNLLLISFLMFSVTVFSQVDDSKKPKMGFYFNPSLNVGLNLKKKSNYPIILNIFSQKQNERSVMALPQLEVTIFFLILHWGQV